MMRNAVPMAAIFYLKMRKQVMDALADRKAGAYMRAMHEAPEGTIQICLGAGRCLCPQQSGDKFCPFCKRYPDHRGSENDAETIISTMRTGN